jgi:hypothetical protein
VAGAASFLLVGLAASSRGVLVAAGGDVRIHANGDLANPLPGAFRVLSVVVIAGTLASWVAWLAVQIPAYRQASGERRQQLKWLYSGAAIFVTATILGVFIVPLALSEMPGRAAEPHHRSGHGAGRSRRRRPRGVPARARVGLAPRHRATRPGPGSGTGRCRPVRQIRPNPRPPRMVPSARTARSGQDRVFRVAVTWLFPLVRDGAVSAGCLSPRPGCPSGPLPRGCRAAGCRTGPGR